VVLFLHEFLLVQHAEVVTELLEAVLEDVIVLQQESPLTLEKQQ
jgi:hypothetical protein